MYRIFPFILSILFFASCKNETEKETEKSAPSTITSLNHKTSYTAGSDICLSFKHNGNENPKLIITNAIGTTLVPPVVNQQILNYCLPWEITSKSEIIKWKVIHKEELLLKGEFLIIPDAFQTNIESYFGPRQITAGNNDFSMLTNIPTDQYDNTLLDGTPVIVKSEFENTIETNIVRINKGIAWKNIGATKKSGRILVSSSCNETNSKQLTTIVFPAKATDFKISYKRDHTYADGNQIIELQTNVIKDEFGNIVSDGTHVNFILKNNKNMRLQTVGNTLNGKVVTKLLHPEQPDTWEIEAYVTGAAKSNTITVDFDASIKDYEFDIDTESRILTIGPLFGFIGQRVSDGLSVDIQITSEDNIIKNRKKLFTKNGLAIFEISKEFYPSGIYDIGILVAGIQKDTTLNFIDGRTE
ncbi:hypothetical protein ACOCEA_15800 [Maribacter sp. CXY002]|uniref:hypothetical protein n=1 Tax=Maribacter luteocoastalis TaxID=3407671 RepID=UPI003B677C97